MALLTKNPKNFWGWLLAMVQNSVGIFISSGAPTSGTTGSYFKVAGPGSLLVDITNAKLYINTNTKVSPTWTVVGTQT